MIPAVFLLIVLFRHISHAPQNRGWERKLAEGPPCVILASPGMLQSGPRYIYLLSMLRYLLEIYACAVVNFWNS
jgi:hypothetical protein